MTTILEELRAKKSKLGSYSDPTWLSKVKEYIPTGVLPLDWIIGGKHSSMGIPVGRLTEISGDTSTGKSLVAVKILAQTQAVGGIAMMLDSETACSPEIMDIVGVNQEELIYHTPETVEEVYEVMKDAIEAKDEACPNSLMTIVWDSVAATSSEEELKKLKDEGLKGKSVATHARLISELSRVLPREIAHKRIALVFINQTKENIGVMWGDKTTTFGGKAIGFYSSLRILLDITSKIKQDANITGINVKATVIKNKLAAPFGTCNFPVMFATGIDESAAIFELLKDDGYLKAGGTWYRFDVAGMEEIPKFQRMNWPEVCAAYYEQIKQLYP